MSVNESPSKKAARAIAAYIAHGWGEQVGELSIDAFAEEVEKSTSCDTLSADLARARDILNRIKQILGNKGDNCKCGVCQAVGLLEGVVWQ